MDSDAYVNIPVNQFLAAYNKSFAHVVVQEHTGGDSIIAFETSCGLSFSHVSSASEPRDYVYRVDDPQTFQIARLRHGF